MTRSCGLIAFIASVTAAVACGSSSKSGAGAPDTTPPAIASTTPANGETAGALAKVAITFSEPMDTSTVAVSASDGTNAFDLGAATWSSGNSQVSFDTPPSPLGFGKIYAVVVDGKDVAGNAMTQAVVTFSVEPQPVVATVAPAGGLNAVAVTNSISLGFNVAAEHASVESALSVKTGASPLTCDSFSWSADSKIVTCGHSAALGFNATYTIDLAATAKSALGDPIAPAGLLPSTFTTAAAPDTTPPTVVGRDTSTDVATNNVRPGASVTIVFSEPVKQPMAMAAFSLVAGTVQTGTFSWDATGTRMTFHPAAALPDGVNATWTVAAGVEDTSGNPSEAPASGSFHVAKTRTVTLPVIASATGYVEGPDVRILNEAYVGDDYLNQQETAYLTFDLSSLSPTPVAFESGRLTVLLSRGWGGTTSLGTLLAQSVNYGTSLETTDASLPTDGLFVLCTSSTSSSFAAGSVAQGGATVSPSIIVLPRFCPYQAGFTAETGVLYPLSTADVTRIINYQWADRTSRGSLAQFRLAFPTPTNNDGYPENVGFCTGPCDPPGLWPPFTEWTNPLPTLDVTYDYPW